MSVPVALSVACLVSVALLLLADRQAAARAGCRQAGRQHLFRPGRRWRSGALASTYGKLILGALVLGWLGDALAVARTQGLMGGLASLLLSHVLFAVAFPSGALSGAGRARRWWRCCSAPGVALADAACAPGTQGPVLACMSCQSSLRACVHGGRLPASPRSAGGAARARCSFTASEPVGGPGSVPCRRASSTGSGLADLLWRSWCWRTVGHGGGRGLNGGRSAMTSPPASFGSFALRAGAGRLLRAGAGRVAGRSQAHPLDRLEILPQLRELAAARWRASTGFKGPR